MACSTVDRFAIGVYIKQISHSLSINLFTLYLKHDMCARSVLFLYCAALICSTRSQQILLNAKIANAKKQTQSLAVNSVDARDSVVPLKVTLFYILSKMNVDDEVSEQ